MLYCMIDKSLIVLLFGTGFESALLPTRLLLITALFECLSQLIVQPFLAAGKLRIYGLCQNGAAILAAFLGWLWIPYAGISAYLIVRLMYVIVPLLGFGIPVVKRLQQPLKVLSLAVCSSVLLLVSLIQILFGYSLLEMPYIYGFLFALIIVFHRQDIVILKQSFRGSI